MRRHVRAGLDDQYSVEIMPASKGTTDSSANTSRYVCHPAPLIGPMALSDVLCLIQRFRDRDGDAANACLTEEGRPEGWSVAYVGSMLQLCNSAVWRKVLKTNSFGTSDNARSSERRASRGGPICETSRPLPYRPFHSVDTQLQAYEYHTRSTPRLHPKH